eukprot:1157902-Pelagomonas_calceolata.AAC.10
MHARTRDAEVSIQEALLDQFGSLVLDKVAAAGTNKHGAQGVARAPLSWQCCAPLGTYVIRHASAALSAESAKVCLPRALLHVCCYTLTLLIHCSDQCGLMCMCCTSLARLAAQLTGGGAG